MKTLVAYATKYGGTKSCAERLARKLPQGAELVELTQGMQVDLAPYDTVIVGCSIYMGKPRKEAMDFCQRFEKELMQKNVGLFLCCMQDMDKAVKQQMALAFPRPLQEHASSLGVLGGVVNYTKLSRKDAFIMKMVVGDLRKKTEDGTLSTVSDERIDRFLELLAGAR